MTESRRDEEQESAPDGVGTEPRRRRKKKRSAAKRGAPNERSPDAHLTSSASAVTSERGVSTTAMLFAAATAVAVLAAVTNALGSELHAFTLMGAGVAAFLGAASSGAYVRPVVAACAATVVIGLAIVATSTWDLGAPLCMAGGLGLAGGIHRLGRLGPDEDVVHVDAGPSRDPASDAS